MKFLLHLKHWQLFLLLVGIPLVGEFIFIVTLLIVQDARVAMVAVPLILLLSIGLFFGWFYIVGTDLHKKLPPFMRMDLKLFKIFPLIPALYIVVISIVLLSLTGKFVMGESIAGGLIGLIILVHLLAMFFIFYCLHFIARALKAVELQRPVTFNDFAGEFS